MQIDRCIGASTDDNAIEPAALELGCDVAAGIRPRQRAPQGRPEGEYQPIGQRELGAGHRPYEQAQGALWRERLAAPAMSIQDCGTKSAPADVGPEHALGHD